MNESTAQSFARRKLLLALAAGGAAWLVLPSDWTKPKLSFGVLPAHAVGSAPTLPGGQQGGPRITADTMVVKRDHTVGTTECPQELGTITLTNPGTEAIMVTASGAKPLSIPNNTVTIPPNGTATIKVFFDCSQTTSFELPVTFDAATASGTPASTPTVNVSLTIKPS